MLQNTITVTCIPTFVHKYITNLLFTKKQATVNCAAHSANQQQSNQTSQQNGSSLLPGDTAKQNCPHGGHAFTRNPESRATSSAVYSEEMKWGTFTLLGFTYRVSERSSCIIHTDGSLTKTTRNDMNTLLVHWDVQSGLYSALNRSERHKSKSQQVRKHHFYTKDKHFCINVVYTCYFE